MHTAPGHGLDDYVVGSRYGLKVDNPVGDDGRFYADVPLVGGMSIWQANPLIVDTLAASGNLLAHEKLLHSYPHCWRHKTPIIFRATRQWFIGMDVRSGKRRAASGRPCASRRWRRSSHRVLPGLGPRAAGGDDQEPSRLVRLAPAQLGRADARSSPTRKPANCIRAPPN